MIKNPIPAIAKAKSDFCCLCLPSYGRSLVRVNQPCEPSKIALGLAMAGIGFLIMVFPANMLVASGGAIKSQRGGWRLAICCKPLASCYSVPWDCHP